jgi:hypothetical protein
MAAEDFKFGTQYTVQGLENTKYNGSIGVFVGLTDQDPARVKLALRSGEILSLKPSKLVPTDERPPKVPRQSPISSSSPSPSPSTPATQGMLQSSPGPSTPATQGMLQSSPFRFPNEYGTTFDTPMTVEAFADCCGVSSSVLLLEFGPGVPTNIIRCEQFEDKTVWHLAALYEIRRLCGISLWEWDKSSVSTYPLDTFIKSREVKNRDHWVQWTMVKDQ